MALSLPAPTQGADFPAAAGTVYFPGSPMQ